MTPPVETFSAPTMHEALARVRESLGPDAIILHTRQIKPKGLLSKKGPHVEVTASAGTSKQKELSVRTGTLSAQETERTRPAPSTSSLEDQVRRLQRLVDRMSGMPTTGLHAARPKSELEEYLRSIEFPENIVSELLEIATSASRPSPTVDDRELIDILVTHLASRIRTAEGIENRTIMNLALIGPTGVGKTTTVARLTAHALELGRPVHLVTIDEYRVGAADEIRRYAEIFGVGWSMAKTPAELRRLIERQPRGTLMLIDTPGRAALEKKEMADLARFLERGITKALVMSSNIRESSARASLDAFRDLDYQHLILTKLDETPGTGAVAGLAMISPVPITYLCLGQSVRGDLQPAEPLSLARWAMGQIARRPMEASESID
ncbi:hypothetical protein K2X85_19570 [bacterium]|jgi:flagellar biosynthesis protein FlhF|nr:hypothetical protein [bacterium]